MDFKIIYIKFIYNKNDSHTNSRTGTSWINRPPGLDGRDGLNDRVEVETAAKLVEHTDAIAGHETEISNLQTQTTQLERTISERVNRDNLKSTVPLGDTVSVRMASSFASGVMNALFNIPDYIEAMRELNIEIELNTPNTNATTGASELIGPINGEAYHPFSNLQMIIDGEADAACADSNYWVSAAVAQLPGVKDTMPSIPRSVGIWSSAIPFALGSKNWEGWLNAEGEELINQQAATLLPGVPLKHFFTLSSGQQVTGYVAAVHDAAGFVANPLAFYSDKKVRTGGLFAGVFSTTWCNSSTNNSTSIFQ